MAWPEVVARRMRWATTLVALVVAMAALAGCSESRVVHDDGLGPQDDERGPLSAQTGAGSFSMTEPEGVAPPWYGSFGSNLLCVRDPTSRVVLERVGWNAADDAPPLSVQSVLRVVNRTSLKTTPFVAVTGKPWKPYDGSPGMPGRYVRNLSGRVVSQPCSDWDQRPPPHFEELVFIVKTSKKGADLTSAYVDYRADGKPYRLKILWQMIACGSAIEARGALDANEEPGGECPKDRFTHRGEN